MEKGDYLIYVATSVADTRNNNNLIYIYTQKELIVTEKLTNPLIHHDPPDVATTNIKPDFNKLFLTNEICEKKIISKNKNNVLLSGNKNHINMQINIQISLLIISILLISKQFKKII